jgi:hypothetical protein
MADDSPKAAPEPTFVVDEWAANADLLGTNRYAVVAALGDERRQNFTKKQAQDTVDRFLKREIVPEPAQPDTNEEE